MVLVGLALLIGAAARSGWCEEENVQIIERVIDANTAVIKGGQKIRFIGVQAPSLFDEEENKRFHPPQPLDEKARFEAADQAKKFVEYLILGHRVRLELEPNFAPFNHRDKDGNILVYVWFASPVFAKTPDWLVIDPAAAGSAYDGFLNAAIVRAGYSLMDRRWPFLYADRFLALENEARQNHRGLWASGPGAETAGTEKASGKKKKSKSKQ